MKNPSQRTFGSFSNKNRKTAEFDIQTANRMLPLVKQIAQDMSANSLRRCKLQRELNQLDAFRRELTWESRSRRYRIVEELGTCDSEMKSAMQELKQLGISVVDDTHSRIGFPTNINNRPAYFTWQPPEEQVQFWNYRDEEARRPIPSDWLETKPKVLS
ncbi:DUF2203 family protein [Telmatocola sphagniphila]|jgi:hypothetical protein|uniref:DUF2203 family protein n=1 Tax=Telmatocola sphagniphila TaxID=1123043 RepID=A0A8E6EYY1_9BACT|nr:DUF2203 family protein [Telmatocola sphagniphila]QVL32831.1 DUF2203 family protein [Telmatocola sphagniphila]